MSAANIEVGTVIAGRYRVERRLGVSSTSTVLEVRHGVLGRRFVMKVLAPGVDRATGALRLQREGKALGRIGAPAVPEPIDVGVDPNVGPFLLMELVDGESLEERLDAEGTLAFAELARIGSAVAKAVAAIHDVGLAHGAISPDHILLTASGHPRVRLVDLRSATPLEGRGAPAAGPYVAPEVRAGGPRTERSDLYSIGVVLLEAATGWLPAAGLVGDEARERARAAPFLRVSDPACVAALREVLDRLLAADPEDRFTSARALADALETLREERSTPRASLEPRRRSDLPSSDSLSESFLFDDLDQETVTELHDVDDLEQLLRVGRLEPDPTRVIAH